MNAVTAGFTRQQRILTPTQYKSVFDKRQSQHSSHFGVYVARNTCSLARLGLVVSKKVSKKAVVRNAVKRRIREFFRQQALVSDMCSSIDYVVVAKAPALGLSTAQFNIELASLFGKAQQRCKK